MCAPPLTSLLVSLYKSLYLSCRVKFEEIHQTHPKPRSSSLPEAAAKLEPSEYRQVPAD